MAKIKGLSKLARQFSNLQNLDYSDALMEGGEILKDKSMDNAPVDTGDLKRSHKLFFIAKNKIELVVRVLYSSIVEFRQPYLRPAIDKNENVISKAVGIGVEDIINKAV